jgi:glycosyltransferase involved in cell wall biosynthesis
MKRLLLLVNEPKFFLTHRLPIAIAAREQGYDVHIASIAGSAIEDIKGLGFPFHSVDIVRGGMNPLVELRSIYSILKILISLKPDILHAVTTKPVLYGSIAARLARTPAVVAAIAGLGPAFDRWGFKRGIAAFLYRRAMSHPNLKAIFQNGDDQKSIQEMCGIPAGAAVLIRGSGVDLTDYVTSPEPEGTPTILMASRLVKSKGPEIFVEAATRIKAKGIKARFLLAGETDEGTSGSITNSQVAQWRAEGNVEVLGYRSDVKHLIQNSNIVVHPSTYGEGIPKILIEAAACGRPIVTTDHPGCRDAVLDGHSGILVPPRSIDDLTSAIVKLINSPDLRRQLGSNGRQLAERHFSIDNVVEQHLRVYDEISGPSSQSEADQLAQAS